MISMMEGFPVAEVDTVMRRTLWSAVAMGVLGVGAGIGFGFPLFGPGVVVGLAMGLVNIRFFQVSAARNTNTEGSLSRGPFATQTLLRLAVVTGVAMVLLVVLRQMGWGVLAGLIVFQMLLLINMLKALMAYNRKDAGHAG